MGIQVSLGMALKNIIDQKVHFKLYIENGNIYFNFEDINNTICCI